MDWRFDLGCSVGARPDALKLRRAKARAILPARLILVADQKGLELGSLRQTADQDKSPPLGRARA
jgi:hypothetical protein